ncbi:hypothetical protein [Massilia niastensis]|uniref:hypothetical protein n=1 Tax=Massilia niastensis TaxID=544911 RepID=UPI0003750143|nr:hypothetical protein [Massilia niastensis]
MYLKKTILATAIAAASLPAFAQQLDCNKSFGFRADVNGARGTTLCSGNVDSFIKSAENFTLSNTGYTQSSAASAVGRFNDVNVVLRYDAASNTLNYNFVELGESGSFTGANRDLSEEQFSEFVKNSDILGKVLRYQAKNSATSALTGVGGVIPMLGMADFSSSFDTASNIGVAEGSSANANNLLGIGLSYGSYNIDGNGDDVKTTSIPLSYTIRNAIDPRRQLVLSLPLTRVTTGGDSEAYHGGLGVAYRFPLSDRWTLTPGARYSVVASRDRATVSTVMSASLMSTYVLPLGGVDLAIGNMIGLYQTGKFSSREFSFDPDVRLKMTRNGLMASVPTSLFNSKMAAEFSLIDTRYLGDEPFVTDSQEIGFTLGTNRRASNARSFTRFGATYVHSKSFKGFTVNLGFWF